MSLKPRGTNTPFSPTLQRDALSGLTCQQCRILTPSEARTSSSSLVAEDTFPFIPVLCGGFVAMAMHQPGYRGRVLIGLMVARINRFMIG